jgi:DNA-binding NtrC family response regulator
MRALIELARRLAGTEITGLIVGEPGTGKMRIARAIHETSPRAGKPLRG